MSNYLDIVAKFLTNQIFFELERIDFWGALNE